MYVMPFWSYLPAGAAVQIVNHLTGESDVFPGDVIDQIEQAGSGDGVSTQPSEAVLSRLQDMRILFEHRAAGISWIEDVERSAAYEQPCIDQIELTNRCPYTCKMCPRTSSMTRSLGDMDPRLFERIIGQMAGRQKYVALHHFGESLLHRDLPQMVRLAHEREIATGLSCNPPSLKPALAERLLAAGVSSLVLSFDSLDAATYRAIRGPAADVERAIRHVDALVALRDAGGHATAIILQLIQMHDNAGEAGRFLQFCREHGVDRGVVVRFGRWDFSDPKADAMGAGTTPLYKGFCMRPRQSVVVLWDGRVAACCHDYDGLVCLGDLTTQSLDEVWAGAPAAAFRNNHSTTKLCNHCAFSRGYRERKQGEVGLRAFHRDRETGTARLSYVTADSERQKNLLLFDGFDVATAEPQAAG